MTRRRTSELPSEFDLGHALERFWSPNLRPTVRSPEDAAKLLREMTRAEQEMFVVLGLTTRQKVMSRRIIHIGSPALVQVHVASMFRGIIREGAPRVIISHNHPSGDCTPTDEDLQLTRRVDAAGELLGIPLLDHIIVSAEGHYSCKTGQFSSWPDDTTYPSYERNRAQGY